jgi:hypothetical protein
MRRVTVSAALIGALSAAGTALAAGDGILIVHVISSGNEAITHRAHIERTRVRSERVGQGGEKETVVFDRTAQILRVMDDGAKTYSEVRGADSDRVGGHMAEALADLRRQLQTASPADRPRVEAMISALTGPPLDYTRTGGDKVGKWACDKYVVALKGRTIAEVCIAEPAALGCTPQDLEIVKPFAEFYSKVTKGGAEFLFNVGLTGPPGSAGIAVSVIGLAGGAAQSKTILTGATRETFPDSLFAVPAGYAKRDFPGMR